MNFTFETPKEIKERLHKETTTIALVKLYELIKKLLENREISQISFAYFKYLDVKLSDYIDKSPEFTFRKLLEEKGWEIIQQPSGSFKILPKVHLQLVEE